MNNVNGKPVPQKSTTAELQIPKFSEDKPISREQVLGSAQPNQPQSEEGAEQSDFLSMVRADNEKRRGAESPAETPRNTRQAPTSGEDTSPEKDGSESTDGAESGDDESFVDPMAQAKKPKKTKEENIKGLRESRDYHRKEREKIALQLEEANKRIEELSSVTVQAEEVERLRARVAELEPLETMIDVMKNPEFRARYVDGLNAQVGEAQKVAKAYKLQNADQFIEQAINIDNRADLNRFLHSKLDEFGVAEIRPYILNAQQLIQERAEVEREPQLHKDRIIEMSRENENRRREAAINSGNARTRDAFGQTLLLYSTGANAIPHLQEKAGDRIHNERRTGILARAGEELGKWVGAAFRNGLQDLPIGMAQTLSARFQLSELASVLVEELRSSQHEAEQLRQTLREVQGFERPDFNTTGTSKPVKTEPKSSDDIARHVFDLAGEKLRASQGS